MTPVQDDRVEPPATNNFAATVQVVTQDGALHETIVRTTDSPLQQLVVSFAAVQAWRILKAALLPCPQVPVPSGEPSVFPSAEELTDKFIGLVSPYCAGGAEEARAMATVFLEAEKNPDVAAMIEASWATAAP